MKKVILVSLMGIGLSMLGGCGNNNANTTIKDLVETAENLENLTENTDTVSENKNVKEDCMLGCEMLWKANEENKDKSKEEMDTNCNSLCDAAEGMENNDPSSCAKSEGIMKDSCYSEIAQETKNPEICESIEDGMMKYACYTSLAETMEDGKLCDKIDDAMWKTICLEGSTGE